MKSLDFNSIEGTAIEPSGAMGAYCEMSTGNEHAVNLAREAYATKVRGVGVGDGSFARAAGYSGVGCDDLAQLTRQHAIALKVAVVLVNLAHES